MNKDYPKISVVMPVYNTEELALRRAIDSILNQTFEDFEFLIIDDGSVNNVKDVVLSYNDERIIYIENEYNKGIEYSLNRGFKLAKGEYIARMDSDDYSYPQRFEKQINLMDSDLSIGLSTAAIKIFDEYNNRTFVYGDSDILNDYFYQKTCLCLNVNFIHHPLVMLRKDFVEKYNLYYSEDYKYAEDYELWSRAFDVLKVVNIPEPLLNYYLSANSVSVKYNAVQRINALRISLNNIKKYYGKDFSMLVDAKYKIVNNEKLTYRDVKLYMDYYTYLTTLNDAKKYGFMCIDIYLKKFVELIKLSKFDIRLLVLLLQSKVLVYLLLKGWKKLRKNLLNIGK